MPPPPGPDLQSEPFEGRSHRFERLGPFPKRHVVKCHYPVELVLAVLRNGPDHDKPVRVWIRKRAEQGGIDEAEDNRVRADAQRQRQSCHHSEAGLLDQHAEAVKDVLPQSRHVVSGDRPVSARLLAGYPD